MIIKKEHKVAFLCVQFCPQKIVTNAEAGGEQQRIYDLSPQAKVIGLFSQVKIVAAQHRELIR